MVFLISERDPEIIMEWFHGIVISGKFYPKKVQD